MLNPRPNTFPIRTPGTSARRWLRAGMMSAVLIGEVSCTVGTGGDPPILGQSSSLKTNTGSLVFAKFGPGLAQTLQFTEPADGGAITEADNCGLQSGRIVEVTVPSPPQLQAVVTPLMNGQCGLTFKDAQGDSAAVEINVAVN